MYADIIQRFNLAFATVTPEIAKILDYQPTTLQAFPTMFSRLQGFTRSTDGGRVHMRYRIAHLLCFVFQDNEEAERQMESYINAVPYAVDVYQSTGGIVSPGMTEIVSGDVMMVNVGGVAYLAIVFYSDTVEKAGRLTGI